MGTVVLAVTAVLGQLDESGSTSAHLKDLQWFVGEWEYTGKEGNDEVTGKTKIEWINDKSFLLVRSVSKRPDGSTMQFTEVIGWDPVKKQVRSWGFGGLGGFGQSMWTKDGNKWTMRSDGPWIRWNGDKLTGTTIRRTDGQNKFIEEGIYNLGGLEVKIRTESTRVKR
jgi:hypothetical protein